MKKQQIYKFGELFSGPGGLAYGAIKTTVEANDTLYSIAHGWANDFDEDTCVTYRKNISPETPDTVICEDIRKLDIENTLTPIDIFAYGFPCNDFSVVGKQKGFNGTYGPLYTYGLRVIDKFNPVAFIAENVGGLRSANEGKAFEKILSDLGNAGAGYDITVNLYKAEEYGVPQTRHRIIIVGIRKDQKKKFQVPEPTHIGKYVTSREAFENPPIPMNAKNNEITKQSAIVIERLKQIKPGQNIWTATLPPHLMLNIKGAKLSQIYKRLDPNKPSYTITGSGGGGTHGYHYAEPRALTNRERARIQTFPDSFEFYGSKESVRKQIGMAVPVDLSKVIFTALLKTLASVPYKSVQSNIKHIQ